MTLQNLLNKIPFETLFPYLCSYYPDIPLTESDYHNAYKEMRNAVIQPSKASNLIIAIELENEIDNDGTNCFDVFEYGEENNCYGVEFASWPIILGYHVCNKSVDDYGEMVVAAQILYRLTFCGFNNEEIAMRKEETYKALDESMREYEENKDTAVGIEELCKVLGLAQEDIPTEQELFKINQIIERNIKKKEDFLKSIRESC